MELEGLSQGKGSRKVKLESDSVQLDKDCIEIQGFKGAWVASSSFNQSLARKCEQNVPITSWHKNQKKANREEITAGPKKCIVKRNSNIGKQKGPRPGGRYISVVCVDCRGASKRRDDRTAGSSSCRRIVDSF